ncbi:MAG: hypothetical protein RL710_2165 [Pseudomonadota bacterium]|jgi:hypothetical protein
MTALRHFYRLAGLAAVLVGTFAFSTPSWSDEGNSPLSALTLRGFGTLGIAHSSNGEAQFVRDLTQANGVSNQWSGKIDSVVGIQANYQVNAKFEAVAQIVSRYGSESNFHPEISWAFLKYEPNAYLNFRAGRIGTDFFMGADSRLIGYSYLSVRPSHDFYFPLLFSYVDGVDAQVSKPIGEGILRAKLYKGFAREKSPVADEFLDIDGAPMAGGFLDYQQGTWVWRASYGQIRFNQELPRPISTLRSALSSYSALLGIPSAQSAADELSVAGKLSRFYSLGMIYDNGPLQAHAMVNRMRHEAAAFEDSEAAMFLLGYRIGTVTPFAGYSWVTSQTKFVDTGLRNAGPLAALDANVVRIMADTHAAQNTTTLGMRWDFRRNMALKLQADVIRGGPQSIFPYRRENAPWNGRTNVLSIALDFIL